jgi:beta-xylosidase
MKPTTFPLALLAAIFIGIFPAAAQDQIGDRATVWGDWPTWGDQGDGTYLNPVLPADYSDIDCICVGSDYYAISSTFQYSPGVVILHSTDLVNWSIVGHAVADVSQISPAMTYTQMNRYGTGIWAGGIRYHNGRYWLYFGTPNEGYFMTTAADPAGTWDPLTQVLASSGWDDCCPFWDDDGQGYLVGTNYANNYTTYVYKLSTDGKQLLTSAGNPISQFTDGVVINTGSGREANKLYKINGIYYHLFSESTSNGRVVKMQQSSTSVMGPYTSMQQLTEGNTVADQPNQGGLVQAANGNWYFYTHHGTGDWEGRCDSLLPVTWINGWPIIGTVDANGLGTMTWSGTNPPGGTGLWTPATSDEFSETTLPQQWEWNYQPRAGYWSLTQRPGWLRLQAFTPLSTNDITTAGDTLTQRSFRTSYNQVDTKLDLSGMTDGQKAGLCHFSTSSPATFGASQAGTTRSLELKVGSTITTGPVLSGTTLWLRSTWALDGVSQFSYSTDGVTFTNFGGTYQLQWASYRGDRMGLYCFNNLTATGQVDVDYFRYAIQPPAPTIVQANSGNNTVDLLWSQVREASSYQVNRATVSGGPYSPVGSPVTGLTYTDGASINNTTYYYTVTTVPIAPATAMTSAAVAATPVSPTSINSSLAVRLRFDEGSGTTAFDTSGHLQNATLVNSPTWAAGKINGCVSLGSASSQYLTLPTGIVSALSGDFSVTAWVNLATTTNWARIFDIGTGQNAYMFLTPQNGSNSRVRFAITTSGGGGEQTIDGTASLPVGTWTHVAVTVSGNTGTLYVNGTAMGTNSALTLKPSALGATANNYLGKSQFNDPYLNGDIDEFEISRRAFSAAEIAAMAAPPSAPAGVGAVSGSAQVALSWNTVSGATTYNVWRSTGSGQYLMIAENVVGNGFVDSSAVNGHAYTYYVTAAAQNVVESADSSQVAATPSQSISADETMAPQIMVSSGNVTVTVKSSVPGHNYQLQYSSGLLQGSWQALGTSQAGTGNDLTFAITAPPGGIAQEFYRVLIQRQ